MHSPDDWLEAAHEDRVSGFYEELCEEPLTDPFACTAPVRRYAVDGFAGEEADDVYLCDECATDYGAEPEDGLQIGSYDGHDLYWISDCDPGEADHRLCEEEC